MSSHIMLEQEPSMMNVRRQGVVARRMNRTSRCRASGLSGDRRGDLSKPPLRWLRSAPVAWVMIVWASWSPGVSAQEVFLEAESFRQLGGWVVDTQSIDAMGSPYLLAHGLGRPVQDAVTEVTFPEAGRYRVFVRTKDWVARWKAPGTPGRFLLLVDGRPVETTFGTEGAEWHWHNGGMVDIPKRRVTLALHDLTGFEGRCDAIYFTRSGKQPPSEHDALAQWRRRQLGVKARPIPRGPYDLVVVGGGYAGMGAALSAARMGCKVALIQNRPVLGGNGSSEVRVWSQGLIRRGRFPRIGEIVEEFADRASKSPGRAEEFEDAKKEAIVRAEPNIELFLEHHVDRVITRQRAITAVEALEIRTGQRFRFDGKLFADCTGHGTVGFLAGADWEMKPKGRMGMSNMWVWGEADRPVEFPETPWALDLHMKDFPYPRNFHGEWFWESGFDKDPIRDAEAIRDWNLRAVYGAFNAMKNREGREKHRRAELRWIAFIGGPRESRRLLGDVILSKEDIVRKREFPDGCVPSTWSIDLHYPKKQFARKYPDNPFISVAKFDARVDRLYGYPIPYRCFYSRNVDNLFMAGRCISVTHEALGTVRVMKTCGMMGEVVGKAASIAARRDCSPRQVYQDHWDELARLLQLPGKARRLTLDAPIIMPKNIPVARSLGPMPGLDPDKLPGIVLDDRHAERKGHWTLGRGVQGFVGYGYLYASPDRGAEITFVTNLQAGRYEVRLAYGAHPNRGTTVPVSIDAPGVHRRTTVDMRKAPPIPPSFVSLGRIELTRQGKCRVTIGTRGANGMVHADAVQFIPAHATP